MAGGRKTASCASDAVQLDLPDVTVRVEEGQTGGELDRISPGITALVVAEASLPTHRTT